MNTYTVLSRQPKVGDEVLIRDEIVLVTGLVPDRWGNVAEVAVERQGETYSISTFEEHIEVIERD